VPETFDELASHFPNLGVWRLNPESQKPAIGGPFC
jgi:hypothetical protein